MIQIDYDKCTGCESCNIACAVKREGVANPLLGRIQVARFENEGIHIPVVCQQCEDAPCQKVCPMHALHREESTLVMSIDYNRCIGCRMCVTACPFGAMLIDPISRKVMKCDQCQEDDGDPICIQMCYPKAIQFVPVTRALYSKRITGAMELRELLSSTGYKAKEME